MFALCPIQLFKLGETAILQRVLETHVREQLDALADLRVSLE